MNPLEVEAAGAVKLNQLEVKLAECQLLAAEIDALGTAEFESFYDAGAVAKSNAKFEPMVKAITRAQARTAAYHNALSAARATATFPRPRGGGK